MKRLCLLACCTILSGCLHTPPGEGKKEPAAPAPAPAVKQEKPDLSASLLEKTIFKGKTTREEIIAKLGPPNSVAKNPYQIPNLNAPNVKLQIPIEMLAAETWNYWKPTKMSAENTVERVLFVKIHLDEKGVALGYQIEEKDAKMPEL